MLYLTQHKRGQVISEQNNGELKGVNGRPKSNVNNTTGAPNWNGASSGMLDVGSFSKDKNGIVANATNVGYKTGPAGQEKYNLTISKHVGKDLPYTITKEIPSSGTSDTVSFKFIDKSYPYADNMISPNLFNNPTADSLFNLIVKVILNNIKLKGLESMKSINLQGFADSARPGKRGPNGTKEEVKKDHLKAGCSEIYCGEKDDAKRNLWLADNRAKRMGRLLTISVKQNNGIDITSLIKYLEPVSSFDPTINYKEGNRVGERSVSINVIKSDDINNPISSPIKYETITRVPTPKIGTVTYGDVTFNLTNTFNENYYSIIVVEKTEEVKKLIGNKIPDRSSPGDKLNGKGMVTCQIKNNEVIVDNLSWGNLEETRSDLGAYAKIIYNTYPNILCLTKELDNTMELSLFNVILSEIPLGDATGKNPP